MAQLLFEIWEGPEHGSFECSRVSRRGDEFRARIEPNARLLTSFFAASDREMREKQYAFHGWGEWKPWPDWEEIFFTDEEAAEQGVYLLERPQDQDLK